MLIYLAVTLFHGLLGIVVWCFCLGCLLQFLISREKSKNMFISLNPTMIFVTTIISVLYYTYIASSVVDDAISSVLKLLVKGGGYASRLSFYTVRTRLYFGLVMLINFFCVLIPFGISVIAPFIRGGTNSEKAENTLIITLMALILVTSLFIDWGGEALQRFMQWFAPIFGSLTLKKIVLKKYGKRIFEVIFVICSILLFFSGNVLHAYYGRQYNLNLKSYEYISRYTPPDKRVILLGQGEGSFGRLNTYALGIPLINSYYDHNLYLLVIDETGIYKLSYWTSIEPSRIVEIIELYLDNHHTTVTKIYDATGMVKGYVTSDNCIIAEMFSIEFFSAKKI